MYAASGPSVKHLYKVPHKSRQPIMVDWSLHKIVNTAASQSGAESGRRRVAVVNSNDLQSGLVRVVSQHVTCMRSMTIQCK